MQKALLYSVIEILEVVSNDVDLMRRGESEFTTTNDEVYYKSYSPSTTGEMT